MNKTSKNSCTKKCCAHFAQTNTINYNKRYMSIILILILCLMSVTTLVSANDTTLPFNDVKRNAWYYDEVKNVYEAKLMEGKSTDKFDPAAVMTRAEFVTVLCRITGDDCTGMGNALTFTDVNNSTWYADYVGLGVKTELVKGFPGNKFAPKQAVTRQEMAVFIDRLVTYLGETLPNNPKVSLFKDTSDVGTFAKDSVELMRLSGIITGDDKGYFNPKSNASRAEVATVIARLYNIITDNDKIQGGIIDPENFEIQKAFLFGENTEDITVPYRIFLPADYSENKEYPVLLFFGDQAHGNDNVTQLEQVNMLFENPNSPVYESIVVVPQAEISWSEAMATKMVALLDYVNSKYSTDTERQYIIGGLTGVWTQWNMIYKYPGKVSAVLMINGPALRKYDIGYLPEDINPKMLDIPIHLLYSMDDKETFGINGHLYGKFIYQSLLAEGATNVVLTEQSGYGADIYHNFVSKDDITLLEWLFAQRRETK